MLEEHYYYSKIMTTTYSPKPDEYSNILEFMIFLIFLREKKERGLVRMFMLM